LKLLSIAGIALLPASMFVNLSHSAAANILTADTGAEIYERSCTSCHGSDGKANTRRGKRKGAKDLTKSSVSVAMGIKIITYGDGEMPSFKDSLTREEIRAVNSYVRGFRR